MVPDIRYFYTKPRALFIVRCSGPLPYKDSYMGTFLKLSKKKSPQRNLPKKSRVLKIYRLQINLVTKQNRDYDEV